MNVNASLPDSYSPYGLGSLQPQFTYTHRLRIIGSNSHLQLYVTIHYWGRVGNLIRRRFRRNVWL